MHIFVVVVVVVVVIIVRYLEVWSRLCIGRMARERGTVAAGWAEEPLELLCGHDLVV